jgi:hypothetical protein
MNNAQKVKIGHKTQSEDKPCYSVQSEDKPCYSVQSEDKPYGAYISQLVLLHMSLQFVSTIVFWVIFLKWQWIFFFTFIKDMKKRSIAICIVFVPLSLTRLYLYPRTGQSNTVCLQTGQSNTVCLQTGQSNTVCLRSVSCVMNQNTPSWWKCAVIQVFSTVE